MATGDFSYNFCAEHFGDKGDDVATFVFVFDRTTFAESMISIRAPNCDNDFVGRTTIS